MSAEQLGSGLAFALWRVEEADLRWYFSSHADAACGLRCPLGGQLDAAEAVFLASAGRGAEGGLGVKSRPSRFYVAGAGDDAVAEVGARLARVRKRLSSLSSQNVEVLFRFFGLSTLLSDEVRRSIASLGPLAGLMLRSAALQAWHQANKPALASAEALAELSRLAKKKSAGPAAHVLSEVRREALLRLRGACAAYADTRPPKRRCA